MNSKMKLEEFLEFFPEVDLPVNLTDDIVLEFSKVNTPLNQIAMRDYISRWWEEDDEFTEYIACFRIKDTVDIHAIVLWRAESLRYDYFLITLDKSGNLIEKKSIASTIVSEKSVKKSVATIDPDWIIHIVAGENSAENDQYNSDNSRAFSMELLADGEIIFSLDS